MKVKKYVAVNKIILSKKCTFCGYKILCEKRNVYIAYVRVIEIIFLVVAH